MIFGILRSSYIFPETGDPYRTPLAFFVPYRDSVYPKTLPYLVPYPIGPYRAPYLMPVQPIASLDYYVYNV